ncbi:MAG: F420-nonreducing hydrogenase [Candidatus Hecatellales archaeon]|nr:MAG: F420-nonreducing hydrogenase [Candidatus Hecatellales archaeon]
MACAGCHVAVTTLTYKLVDLLKTQLELVHSYILMDRKDIPDGIDVAIVEGGVKTSHDEEVVKELRVKSKVLIAIGDCACFGGIPGLINIYDLDSAFKAAYVENLSTVDGFRPTKDLPETKPHALPISEVVKVDYMIPGCPPRDITIENVLTALLSGEQPKLPSTTVCDECPKKKTGKPPERLRRLHEPVPDPDQCLLEQGFLCLGPVTRAGCKAECPAANIPCDGCYGPSDKTWDQGLAMLDGLIGAMKEKTPRIHLETLSGLINRYTFAASILGKLARKKPVKP